MPPLKPAQTLKTFSVRWCHEVHSSISIEVIEVMSDVDTDFPLPEQSNMMREMAQDMNVALYRRYGEAATAKLLSLTVEQLNALREQGEIGYLDLGDNQVSFFGCQILTYLLGCVVPPGTEPRQQTVPVMQSSKPAVTVDAELISVDDAIVQLGIGKTKFYELMNTKELPCVKIGRRTLIKRDELRSYIDKQIA